MPKLPRSSGREAIRAFEILGFTVVRQRGSHVVLRRGGIGCVVPDHRELKTGSLAGAPKQAGVSVDEFLETLRKSELAGAGQLIQRIFDARIAQ